MTVPNFVGTSVSVVRYDTSAADKVRAAGFAGRA